MGWSGKAGDSFELKYQCSAIPDARFVKSSQLHHFTWMSKAAACIWWTLAVKNSCSVFFYLCWLFLVQCLFKPELLSYHYTSEKSAFWQTPLKFVFLPVRCRCLAASLFSSLCNPFPWKYKRKLHPDFLLPVKSEGYLADLWLHCISCPCVKKIQIWLKWEPVLQSSAHCPCFERVLRCVVFQCAACMLRVCVHLTHGHSCCSFTSGVGDSAWEAECQHLCIDKEVKGGIWLPKYWHLVLL